MPTYDEWKRENWDRAHREQDISALTGTGLGGHLNTLLANDLMTAEATVLCVGVGTGKWVYEAAERAKEVWALDISSTAKQNIPSSVKFITDLIDLPWNKFDLALSLWVAPHTNDIDLQKQFAGIIGSLNPGGVFAIHYKEPLNSDDILDNREGASDEWNVAMRAMMLRRPTHFAAMVNWAGGYIIKTNRENKSQFYSTIEAIAHIGAKP